MRAVCVALVVVMSACGKGSGTSASGSASGSAAMGSAASGSAAMASGTAGSGSADTWAKAPPPSPTCDEADIKKHIADSLAVSLTYLDALEKKAAKWTIDAKSATDCERAKKDLLALEPQATKFMAAMTDFVSWAQTLGPCAARVQAIGDTMPEAAAIEKRTPGLELKIKPILEKCNTHPGFTEAAAKGLRVMHRKKAPPP